MRAPKLGLAFHYLPSLYKYIILPCITSSSSSSALAVSKRSSKELQKATKHFKAINPHSKMMKAVQFEQGEASTRSTPGMNKGISILDFILRIVAVIGTLASAIAMGTTNETLPFFTQFIQFRAQYSDLPTFTFFVIANALVSAYLILSLVLSIFHIVRSGSRISRITLIFFDSVSLTLLTAGASAAAAIVYLAHKGNVRANWFAICQQFNSFCERISGSLIGSFVGIVVFILLISMSAVALSRS